MNQLANLEGFNLDAPMPGLDQMMKNHMPDNAAVREVMEYITGGLEEQAFLKSIQGNKVPFPPKNRGEPGMQSVYVDEYQILINGDYMERPGLLTYDSMRTMVEQTPVLSSVIMTRIRQVQGFCRVQESGSGPGFAIRHIDRDHMLTASEKESVILLQKFFDNCGWEFNPRERKRLKRDSFTQFMTKSVADSLTMDSAPIETEFKKNKQLGIEGFYAVDGATIRLCNENGYHDDDEIYALQVIDGRIRTAYTYYDLIYEARNPRANVQASGYGLGEVELLIKTVTGYLNAMTHNSSYFDNNSLPMGVMHLCGNYSDQDVASFKRYWKSMVSGVTNKWQMPVMISKDMESKAAFEKFGADQNEMMFSKWMVFLTAVICAIYGMDPAEINSESFSAGKSSLSGDDTTERIAASKDKGLRPLLAYYENMLTDYIVKEFSDKYVFRWTGLDEDDEEKRFEMRKAVLTVNEIRAQEGYEEHEDPNIGKAPINTGLIGLYMQSAGIGQEQQQGGDQGDQQEQEDFGQPDSEQQPDGDANEAASDNPTGEDDQQQEQQPEKQDFGKPQEQDFGKSFTEIADRFGMPLMTIGDYE